MAEASKIEWTDATWNPITGCSIVDAGCSNCYAMTLAGTRLRNHPSRSGLTRVTGGRAKWTGEVRLNEQWLDLPMRWTRPRMIFVCAHGDLFHEAVPDEWIDRVFAVMHETPQHTYQVLTKRPRRMASYLRDRIRHKPMLVPVGNGILGYHPFNSELHYPRHIWLGTSVSDQASADTRIPWLQACPAHVRFISAEPLLGRIDLRRIHCTETGLTVDCLTGETIGTRLLANPIHWVIVGGESGPSARPMHPKWARGLRDQCQEAGIPFFFKQWGQWAPWDDDNWSLDTVEDVVAHERAWEIDGIEFLSVGKKRAGRLLDGRIWDEMPRSDHHE